MSGVELTLEIGHSCGDQNTNELLLLSAKHENMESLKLYQCLKDSADLFAPFFLPKTAEFCICLNPSVCTTPPLASFQPSSGRTVKARHSTH